MKKITTIFTLLFLTTQIIIAQQTLQDRCASTEIMNAHFKKHPELKLAFDSYQAKVNKIALAQSNHKTTATPNYTIPMVFHILHLNGTENISDAQVIDAVKVLNIDYAKQNADTINTLSVFKPIADSTSIRFALAKKDPNGNCTSGIIHYYDTDANWNDTSPTLYSQGWDPTKYLNVYVVKTITLSNGFGAAGYTYLPGSFGLGSPEDAIVVLHSYIGTIGTSIPFHSHVLTHEVGHWFNLNHVFGWNSCGVDCNNDDFVNDTPQTPGYLSCPTSYSICNSSIAENYQNFMDYSYCETMFTHDQALRMDAAAHSNIVGRDNLWSASNLATTGVSPMAACAPLANFQSNKQTICIGETINFTDLSSIGTPTNWSWTFEGGSPNSSNVQNPTITYSTPGTYSVQLIASNINGTSAPETKNYYITVLPNPISTFLSESFEGSSIPNSTWSVRNVAPSITNWAQSSFAAATGSNSAYIDESIFPGATNELYSPTYNFSAMPGLVLTLKWAGAERDATSSSYDVFTVMFSTNCGATWSPRLIRNIKTGTAGLSGVVNGNFRPTPSQFKQEIIPLGGLTSATNILFKLKFTAESGSSNNFYVDDINLTNTTNLKTEFQNLINLSIYPNPANQQTTILFDLLDAKDVDISLHDILGRTALNINKKRFESGNHSETIDISNLSKGLYFISINVNGINNTQKIVIE